MKSRKAKTEIDSSEKYYSLKEDLFTKEQQESYKKLKYHDDAYIDIDDIELAFNNTSKRNENEKLQSETTLQKLKNELNNYKNELYNYQNKNKEKIDKTKNSDYYTTLAEDIKKRKESKNDIQKHRQERDKLLKKLPFGGIRASWARLIDFFKDLPGNIKKTARKAWRGTVKGIWFALTLPFRIIQKAITIPFAILSFPITAIVDYAKGQKVGTTFKKIAKAGDRTFEKARSAVVNTLSHQTKKSQLKDLDKNIERIKNRTKQKKEILGKNITTQENQIKIAKKEDEIKKSQESRKTTKTNSKEALKDKRKELGDDLKRIKIEYADTMNATTVSTAQQPKGQKK